MHRVRTPASLGHCCGNAGLCSHLGNCLAAHSDPILQLLKTNSTNLGTHALGDKHRAVHRDTALVTPEWEQPKGSWRVWGAFQRFLWWKADLSTALGCAARAERTDDCHETQ